MKKMLFTLDEVKLVEELKPNRHRENTLSPCAYPENLNPEP